MTKIFLVEDNPDHAFLITQGLNESGCEIVHYADGKSILDFFSGDPSCADCPAFILLDLKLPGVDGFEVLREIRKHPKAALIPVIFLTTSKHQQEINKAYRLGASGFVTKSEDFDGLLAKLRRLKDYWLRTVERPKFEEAKA